ncbi:MAG: tetratricopeptide repeat protein [candidate division Zixibacteria bacterium]
MKKITKSQIAMILLPAGLVILSCGLFAPSEDAYLKNYTKAHEFMIQNQPEKAIPLYRKVLKQKEDFKNAYQEMAVCYQQLGEIDSALIYYQGAIVYNPANVDAYQSIGNIYYTQGKYDDAVIWYERASEVDELYPRTYQNMATIWLARKNYNMAKKYFEMAITVDATYPRGYYGLALVALSLGDPDHAESRFLDAVRVGSMPEAIYMLGQMYFEQKKFDKSKEWFEKYLEKESAGQWAEKARDMLFLIEQEK